MSRIRGKNTSPELVLRKLLWSSGVRYRLNYKIGRIRPDLVFVGAHLVVFVDGCFWHRCPIHGVMPKSNTAFWEAKLARNVERDRENTKLLEASGWRVMRFWEHEIEASAEDCAARIATALGRHAGGSLGVT